MEPIILANIQSTSAQSRSFELALAEMQAKPENLPLGRPVKYIHAEVGIAPIEIESQAIRLSQLNHPLAIFGGPGAATALALGKGISSDPTIGFAFASPTRLAQRPNLLFVELSRRQQIELAVDWLLEQKTCTKIQIPFVPGSDEVLIEGLTQALKNRKEFNIVTKDADCVIICDFAISSYKSVLGPEYFMPDWMKANGSKAKCLILGRNSGEDGFWKDVIKNVAREGGKPHCIRLTDDPAPAADFNRRFREKYLEVPSIGNRDEFLAFDMLVQAIRRSNSTLPGRVLEELVQDKKPFESMYGPVQFDADHALRFASAKIVPCP